MPTTRKNAKNGGPRKVPVTIEDYEKAREELLTTVHDLEAITTVMKKRGLKELLIDGAGIPERAASLLRIFYAKSEIAIARG